MRGANTSKDTTKMTFTVALGQHLDVPICRRGSRARQTRRAAATKIILIVLTLQMMEIVSRISLVLGSTREIRLEALAVALGRQVKIPRTGAA
jgi:hypothetical protein